MQDAIVLVTSARVRAMAKIMKSLTLCLVNHVNRRIKMFNLVFPFFPRLIAEILSSLDCAISFKIILNSLFINLAYFFI